MMSKLTAFLKDHLPSYRNGRATRKQIEQLDQKLMQRMNQLDYKMEYLFWLLEQDGSGDEAKKRVFSMLPRAQGEARMIQLTNLELLKRVKAVCDQHEIPFYLMFGNLLGAVRNQGFIPWDDDVDIAMLREDYDRFCAVVEHDASLQVVDVFSSHYHKFTKVKFRDSDTFFVDIFILDVIDATPDCLAEHYDHLRYLNLQYVDQVREYFVRNELSADQYVVPKEVPGLAKEMRAYFDTVTKSCEYYGHGTYVCLGIDNAPFVRNAAYVYEKQELLAPNTVMFEGIEFRAFGNVEIWLKNTYGDYWSFPKNMMSGHSDLAKMTPEDLNTMRKYLAGQEEAEQWFRHCRYFGDGPIRF